MSICKAEAIVLKSISLRESSRIVTLYSRDYGKMKIVAKGVLLPGSRFSGSLENFSRVKIVFYKKENIDLYTLSQVDLIDPFYRICKDLNKFAAASSGMELLDKSVSWEESMPGVFDLSLDFLSQVESAQNGSLQTTLLAYVLKLVTLLGYKPKLEKCVACDGEVRGELVFFSPERGGLICASCWSGSSFYIRFSEGAIQRANKLRRMSLKSAGKVKMPEKEAEEILSGILDFLDFHTGRGKDLKSMEFFKSVKP